MLVMLTFMTSEYSVWLSSKMSISMNKVFYSSSDVKYCFDQRFRWIKRIQISDYELTFYAIHLFKKAKVFSTFSQ